MPERVAHCSWQRPHQLWPSILLSGEAGSVVAPAQAKESAHKGFPSIILVGPLQARPVALLGQRLEFGASCGSDPGTVLQGVVS